ncbi:MAG: transglutaminase-like domain-containing protein [Rubrivivax sp.]|nr:transglutaminase-like domain-containing protein [Rubrivivax sp.]
MAGPVSFEAPTALDFFAALVADDASLPLLEAAIAVAQDDLPDTDVQAVLAEVDTLADRLCRRLPADASALQRLRLLNQYFFQELGFAGNVNNHYDPGNSLLPVVLATRRGIPLTLALIYIEIANQAGLQAQGVAFPGHFLVKLHLPRGEVVVDPYSGRSLNREELEERLLPFRRPVAGFDIDDVPLGLYLQPAPARDILARLLHNLKEIHLSAQDLPRLTAVQRRLVLLLPQAYGERRDLALALGQVGRPQEAAVEMSTYLQYQPDADDAPLMRTHLTRWRRAH